MVLDTFGKDIKYDGRIPTLGRDFLISKIFFFLSFPQLYVNAGTIYVPLGPIKL